MVATPLAVAIALYITYYAPRRLAAGMGYVIDLLAAIPSIVYGFWGIATLAPALVPFYKWAEQHLGFLPLFAGPASATGRTMLTAGLVLAIMILPIISAISREVFGQAPALHREAALALGATRWEMIRMAVLPYGKSGVIGGAMLGLGRALGETLAIAIVLSASGGITFNLISQQQPLDDRGQHRAAVPRVDRPGREHADRQRPGPVRHHPRRQHARPVDRQPAGRLLRSQLMTATRPADPGTVTRPSSGVVERHQRLPRFGMPALFLFGVLAGAGLSALTGFSVVLAVVYAVVLGTLAVYVGARVVEGRRKATDRLVTCVVTSAFAIAMVPLVSLVWTVLSHGLKRLDGEFFNSSMLGIVGEGGGAYHAIFGTLIITAITAVISVPIGLLTAIYLVEYGRGRLKRAITFLVDVMTGIPSIVAGLFAFALFAIFFGPGVRLGIMGAIALSVLMIPVVVRSSEEVLKLVPNELREAAYALGVPKWRTIVKVVLPTAIAGLATGVTLAVARVVGETAPLLITVGIINGTNLDPFDGRMATLPVFAYYQLTQPGFPPEFAIDRAWTAALLLIILVMALNIVARLISRFFAPKTGR